MACPGSANLDLAIPNWVEPVRDETVGMKAEGTRMHALFEKVWELNPRDMRDFLAVVQYITDLRQTRRFKVLIEETVEATWLKMQPKTTADLVLYTQDEIHVIDTKWGKIPVSVIDNDQLKFYAVCYALLAPKAKGVHLHILQPKADNMDTVFVTSTELKAFMDEAIEAERKIMAHDLTLIPNDHCTFCPANPHSRGDKGRPFCPAMMRMLYPPVVDDAEILSL